MCQEMNFASIQQIKKVDELKKEFKNPKDAKKYMNQFDLVLVDDRVSMNHELVKISTKKS